MPNIKIFFSEDSQYREMEVLECQGHRSDVLVIVDDKIYHPIFCTPWRQKVDINNYFSSEIEEKYMIENNVIIMENLDRETVINTILKLSKTSYFSYCAPYNLKMLEDCVFDDEDEFILVYPERKVCSKKDILNYL
jgi:hypothetical protein